MKCTKCGGMKKTGSKTKSREFWDFWRKFSGKEDVLGPWENEDYDLVDVIRFEDADFQAQLEGKIDAHDVNTPYPIRAKLTNGRIRDQQKLEIIDPEVDKKFKQWTDCTKVKTVPLLGTRQKRPLMSSRIE